LLRGFWGRGKIILHPSRAGKGFPGGVLEKICPGREIMGFFFYHNELEK
jgi:hypothetical protein